MRSLRSYLIAMAVLLVLLVCAAAGLVIRQIDIFGRGLTERQLLDTTRALSLAVDGQIQRYEGILQALGGSDNLARQDWAALDRQARALRLGSDAWIVLADRNGHQFVNTRFPWGAKLPTETNLRERWSVLDRGEIRICNLIRGRIERNILCVEEPVVLGGRPTYHLSLVFRPRLLQAIVESQRLRPGQFATVVDRQGTVIWRNVNAGRFVGHPATANMMAAMAHANEGVRPSVSLDGVPTLAAFSRSSHSGWAVLVAVSRSELSAGITSALRWGAAGVVGLLLLGVILALFAARRVTSAVDHLSAAALRIGEGHPPRFEPSGIAEIDAVGSVLDRAVADRDASEERFALAQDVGGIGAWEWDISKDLGYVSDSYKRMHGLTHISGALRIAQVRAVIHPDDLPAYSERLAAAKLRNEPSVNEYRVVHGDGSIHWIAAKGRPLFAADGELIGGIGIVRDVTAERQADQALRDSETRLALATEAADLGIWDWDPRLDIMLHSDRARIIFGLASESGVKLDDLLAAVHPGDRALVADWFRRAIDPALRDRRPLEFRLLRADGGSRWVLVHGRPLFEGAAGEERAVRHIGTVLDITEQKEAEQALRRLNVNLEHRVEERTAERDRLWSLSRDPFVISDDRGVWLAVSPAVTALLGWTEEELIGRTSEWIEHPDDRARTREEDRRLASGLVTERFENRFRTRDGSYRWLSWTSVPEGGRFYSVARDVTAEREQARVLRETEEALRQSQKMESIGQITGGLAHDFNNLLAPIVGALDLLQQRGLPDPRSLRLVGGAIEAAERARMLLQRLLAFARRQPLQPGAIDVPALVVNLKELLGSTLGANIRLILDADEGLPPALADANQLELAIINLAVNARDAMPDGGSFTVTVGHEEVVAGGHPNGLRPGRYVRLIAADTGMGMPPTVVERATEPFFSTKGSGRGTGLGLSMVHGLLAQLGGGMRIDSAVGAGTSILMWLPVAEIDRSSPASAPSPIDPTAHGTVLLVDDDALVRHSTAQMLLQLGYTVTEAESAAGALAILQMHPSLDILVTDHLMPEMTGTELARRIRQLYPEKTVLIISGYADIEDIAPDLPRLSKPFRQSELAAAISEARRRQARAQAQ